jgi:LAO/AO transport system kinase
MLLCEAAGFDVVLVETVGVGQTELDIMRLADTVVVVLVPEAGDAVQVMKAGLLEIADVFVVNKSDREGADRLEQELVAMLGMRPATPGLAPVLRTEARRGIGTEAVVAAIDRHRAEKHTVDDESRRIGDVLDILDEEVQRRLHAGLSVPQDGVAPVLEAVRAGTIDPYAAAVQILADPALLSLLVTRGARG